MSEFCCPLCQKKVKAKKAKPLYGTKVCKKCYYGMANRRQFAYIIDAGFWMFFLVFISGFIFCVIGSLYPDMTFYNDIFVVSFDVLFDDISNSDRTLSSILFFSAVVFIRYIIFPMIFGLKDGFWGRSFGKNICGIEVLDRNTLQPIGFGQSFRRNLILVIPLMPLLVAGRLCKGYRLGDKWANTKVVLCKHRNHPVFTGSLTCEECQYNLRGNVTGACPECGHPIPGSNQNRVPLSPELHL